MCKVCYVYDENVYQGCFDNVGQLLSLTDKSGDDVVDVTILSEIEDFYNNKYTGPLVIEKDTNCVSYYSNTADCCNLSVTKINGGNYNILLTDNIVQKEVISTGDIITLPSGANVGQEFTIKDASGSATSVNLIIDTAGSELIDGSSTYLIMQNYDSRTFYFDGNNYYIK